MKNLDLTLLIVAMLLEDSSREQCIKVLDCPDGDLRAHAQARIKVLDNIQKEAQTTIYRETPPAMIYAGDLQDWWIEKYGVDNFHHIDFRTIANNKKMEWYAYSNHIVETQL